MNIIEVAKICHEVNKAYSACIGDNSHKPWEEAPQWQKESAIKGVEYLLKNPNSTAKDLHDEWYRWKALDGWVCGEVKDEEKKTHPCMVSYDMLDKKIRIKDFLFSAVVMAHKEEVDFKEEKDDLSWYHREIGHGD